MKRLIIVVFQIISLLLTGYFVIELLKAWGVPNVAIWALAVAGVIRLGVEMAHDDEA